MGLLNDVFIFAENEVIKYKKALDMLKYLEKENTYIAWSTVRRNLDKISFLMEYSTEYASWRKFVRKITNKILNQLTIEDKGNHLER